MQAPPVIILEKQGLRCIRHTTQGDTTEASPADGIVWRIRAEQVH